MLSEEKNGQIRVCSPAELRAVANRRMLPLSPSINDVAVSSYETINSLKGISQDGQV